ncbi:YrdB family protein [Streptomyces rubellomurinus]|uniref:YrdB family protein n=1 Tax=Streptomyces rubellomurinus (strain ATCC 31215) TaxID=359131 RepID=UPI0005F0D750|nr:YrdB family protein [Streptomyces rubellomurinus]
MEIKRPNPAGGTHFTPLTGANAALAFTLELAMLAALGYWGFRTGSGLGLRLLLGLGAPALAIALWSLFLAAGGPRFPQPTAVTIVLKLLVLGSAGLALYAAGRPTLALVYGALVVLSVTVEYSTR